MKVPVYDRPNWWEQIETIELRECPFCGNEPTDVCSILTNDDWYDGALRGEQCWCISCYCGCSLKGDSKEDVVKRWNEREI